MRLNSGPHVNLPSACNFPSFDIIYVYIYQMHETYHLSTCKLKTMNLQSCLQLCEITFSYYILCTLSLMLTFMLICTKHYN